MFDESRISIYNFLYNLFYDVVTKNVYSMREPQELTKSDTENGFIVIHVGDLHDESEFNKRVYGWVRCFVQAYIPPVSRGRLDYKKYADIEDAINATIENAIQAENSRYNIRCGSVLSNDEEETNNANNSYYTFIKSFIVDIL